MSTSTNSGCGTPPNWSASVGVLSPVSLSLHDFADIPFQSRLVGVRYFAEQEQAVSPVVSANATRPESKGQHNISKGLGSGSEAMPRPGSVFADGRGVLTEKQFRAKLLKNADCLSAETRSRCIAVSSGVAVLLARVTKGKQIDWSTFVIELVGSDTFTIAEVGFTPRAPDFPFAVRGKAVAGTPAELCDITESWDVRPSVFEDFAGIGCILHLKRTRQAGQLKAQVKSAESGK